MDRPRHWYQSSPAGLQFYTIVTMGTAMFCERCRLISLGKSLISNWIVLDPAYQGLITNVNCTLTFSHIRPFSVIPLPSPPTFLSDQLSPFSCINLPIRCFISHPVCLHSLVHPSILNHLGVL
jgi:hypothetical protein